MMKVLIAIDATLTSNLIIKEIAMRKWVADTSMCMLYVVNPKSRASEFVDVESYVAVENEAATSMVRSMAKELQRNGLKASATIIKGGVAKTIIDHAKQWEADLLIIGSNESRGLASFFLGSTASEVIRHAPCTVEIIKKTHVEPKNREEGMKILLATDGSSCSIAAAHAITEREWSPGSEIKVINVIPASIAAIEPLPGIRFIGTDLTGQNYLVEPIEEVLMPATRIIEEAGLPVSQKLLFGNPKQVIIEHAKDWHADLIVVGSHGRRGLARIFEGSVSEAVAMHAPCAVVVVHEHVHQ
jgi:nucleotide-binding universal stress UspA family protein